MTTKSKIDKKYDFEMQINHECEFDIELLEKHIAIAKETLGGDGRLSFDVYHNEFHSSGIDHLEFAIYKRKELSEEEKERFRKDELIRIFKTEGKQLIDWVHRSDNVQSELSWYEQHLPTQRDKIEKLKIELEQNGINWKEIDIE